MSAFAILGATGATGQQLVKCLLQNSENELHLYVRSKSKLLKIFPGLEDNKKVRIFEGSMNDTALLSSCIASTKALFTVLASNDNTPGMTIARDSAVTVLSALKDLKEKDKSAKLPRVVVLSSASVNHHLYKNEPKLLHWIIYRAFWHVYRDLEVAEQIYAQEAKDGGLTVDVKYIHPGALVEGGCSGTVSLNQAKHSAVVTYGDLARAMVQAGEEAELEHNNFGVVVDGKLLSLPPTIAVTVLRGLLWTFAPWMHRFFQYLNVM